MQKVINLLREKLTKNEDFTMSDIGNAAKMSFQSIKTSLSESDNEVVKMALEAFRQHIGGFETAIKQDDRQQADRLLGQLENTVQHLKTQTM